MAAEAKKNLLELLILAKRKLEVKMVVEIAAKVAEIEEWLYENKDTTEKNVFLTKKRELEEVLGASFAHCSFMFPPFL